MSISQQAEGQRLAEAKCAELQKELESLKRSLSVYLGPGLQSRTPLKSN